MEYYSLARFYREDNEDDEHEEPLYIFSVQNFDAAVKMSEHYLRTELQGIDGDDARLLMEDTIGNEYILERKSSR